MPTNEEMIAWIDKQIGFWRRCSLIEEKNSAIAALKAIRSALQEPRLPKEPTSIVLNVMQDAYNSAAWLSAMDCAYYALYSHLTTPPKKTVWRVSWTGRGNSGAFEDDFATLDEAAESLKKIFGEATCTYTIAPIEVDA